jgi:hypothetical protein
MIDTITEKILHWIVNLAHRNNRAVFEFIVGHHWWFHSRVSRSVEIGRRPVQVEGRVRTTVLIE